MSPLYAARLVVTAKLVHNSDAGRSEILKRVLGATKDATRNWHSDKFHELHSLTNAVE
jgi:hypothetical protein